MPNPRPHNITIQLPPPIRGIVVAPGETGVGGCTPSVTGLGWCHFLAASRAYLSGTNAAETEFQLLVPDEVPTCSSADIEFMLQDGVVDIAKIGLYEFRLIGETCSCIQEWIVTFKDVQLHPSNFHHFLMQPNGNTLSVYWKQRHRAPYPWGLVDFSEV